MTITPPVVLSDAQLVAEVKRLVRCERGDLAQLVVHLADLDDRRIPLAAGFPSLYVYCVEELGLTEYEAYSRIEVARAGKAFPRIFRMLGEGALSLTTVQLLARRLTAENQDELLPAAAGRSKREVQELLARHFPQPGCAGDDTEASAAKINGEHEQGAITECSRTGRSRSPRGSPESPPRPDTARAGPVPDGVRRGCRDARDVRPGPGHAPPRRPDR